MAAHTSSTTTFPVPASARVHPTTTSPPATTTPGTASTPTTTYIPPAGATTRATIAPVKSTLNARPLAHARSKPSETLSTGAIAIAVVAALLVLACIGWALARRRAFEPHWLLSLRHAIAEAGFRASATWAEFADWARLGH